MAKVDHAKSFLNNIAASAAWESFKTWGWLPVTSLLAAIWQRIRHGSVDWYGIGALFLLTCLGVWLGRSTTPRKTPVEPNIPTVQPPAYSRGEVIGFGGRDTLEEVEAEHAHVMSVGNKLDGAFTMLQIEAISLASFLQRFMDTLEESPFVREGQTYDEVRGKAYVWGIKVKTLYERDCAPEVNRFVQRAKIEMGYSSRALDNYKDTVHGVENIETVRAQLWLFVIRSLNVDLNGEI